MNRSGAIEQRLEKLECQNRRLKLSALVVVVIAGAFVLMGQTKGSATPREVRAKSFVLVDSRGKVRAKLTMSAADEGSGLTLYDANGKLRLMLTESSDGPMLGLNDANENSRATLSIASDGPELLMWDAKGNSTAILGASSNGSLLGLHDANGHLRAMLTAALDGSLLDLDDANGKSRATLSTDGPGLQLSEVNGFETDIGVADLLIPTTGETRKTSAASIVMFGKDKKVLWSAPPQN